MHFAVSVAICRARCQLDTGRRSGGSLALSKLLGALGGVARLLERWRHLGVVLWLSAEAAGELASRHSVKEKKSRQVRSSVKSRTVRRAFAREQGRGGGVDTAAAAAENSELVENNSERAVLSRVGHTKTAKANSHSRYRILAPPKYPALQRLVQLIARAPPYHPTSAP